jgi:hypothetical protein
VSGNNHHYQEAHEKSFPREKNETKHLSRGLKKYLCIANRLPKVGLLKHAVESQAQSEIDIGF